jgi:hypothetical protein
MKRKWIKHGLIILIFAWLSWLCKLAIYPCKTAPVVLNPLFEWNWCEPSVLKTVQMVGLHKLYFGFEQGWMLAVVFNFIIAWGIVYFWAYLYKKYKK